MKIKIIFLTAIFLVITSCSKNKETVVPSPDQSAPKDLQPKIDYDLSSMNYNMLSSITFEMLVEPEKYTDKTVKMSGQFYSEVYEEKRYYSVIVWDATRCCPAGMDFIPPDSIKYPDDFPQSEQKITVTGKLVENAEDGNLIFKADKIEF